MKVQDVTNPTQFYIRFNSESLKRDVKRIEREIALYVANVQPMSAAPANGSVSSESCKILTSANLCFPALQIVGFFHVTWVSWIRVKVISRLNSGWFEIFLVDYGYTMRNEDVNLFCELPERLKKESDIVKEASLVLKPCELVVDNQTKSSVQQASKLWSNDAIKFMKNLVLSDSREFLFETYGQHNGTLMGDVIIKSAYDAPYSISKKLIEASFALQDDNPFLPKSKKHIACLPEEPIANFQKIYSAFHPDEDTTKRNPVELPAINLGTHERLKPPQAPSITNYDQPNKKEESVPRGSMGLAENIQLGSTKETLKPPQTPRTYQICSPENYRSATPPLHMLVFGEHLRPPFESIPNTTFRKEIKGNLRTMSNIQSYSWAQIHHGRSMLIIGEKSRSEPFMDYLPAIVNLIKPSRADDCPGIGPVAVVIGKTKSYCGNIVKALQILQGITVVEALGAANKVVELMNGCDVLVTTPGCFGRLIDGISLNVFDKVRIKHLIFDGFDSMLGDFDKEINAIIRACTNGRAKPETNPQLIVTSDSWIKDIEIKLLSLKSPSETVICIDSFIEAAASIGCKFTCKTSKDLNEKVKSLLESFEDGMHKKLRTLVVTNDEASLKIAVKALNDTDKVQVLEAREKNLEESKTAWSRETTGHFSVLVVSDSVLSKMELRNVQNLIHFDTPKSWSVFVRRFGVLLEEIYKNHRVKSVKEPPTTKVFLDNENLDQFVEIINFLETRKLANVPAIAIEYVKVSCYRNSK